MFDPTPQSLLTMYLKTVSDKQLDVVTYSYSYHFLNENNTLPTFIAGHFGVTRMSAV